MEDKVFLDEAGLGEVGKVISKHYAKREEFDRDKKRKEVIPTLTDSNYIYSYVDLNYLILDGTYCVDLKKLYRNLQDTDVSEEYSTESLYSLWKQGQLPDLSMGVAIVRHETSNDGDAICQTLYDTITGLTFKRTTKEAKREYKEDWIMDNYDTDETTIIQSLLSDEAWSAWAIGGGIVPSALPVASGTLEEGHKPGLMTPDDKKKLDSVNVDKIINKDSIVNDLTTGGVDKVLSAEQGKILFQYANEGKEKMDLINMDKIKSMITNSNVSGLSPISVGNKLLGYKEYAKNGFYVSHLNHDAYTTLHHVYGLNKVNEKYARQIYIDNCGNVECEVFKWNGTEWEQVRFSPKPKSVLGRLQNLEQRVSQLEKVANSKLPPVDIQPTPQPPVDTVE